MTAAIRGMGPIKTIAMGKLEVTKSNNIVMKDDDNLTVIADVRGQKPLIKNPGIFLIQKLDSIEWTIIYARL